MDLYELYTMLLQASGSEERNNILSNANIDVPNLSYKGANILFTVLTNAPNNISLIDFISKKYPSLLSSRNDKGKPPLHIVQNANILRLLINNGANINEQDASGRTALYFSLGKELMDVLLSHRANPNIQDVGGQTALHICVINNDVESAIKLINNGAKNDILDFHGISVLDLAKDNALMTDALTTPTFVHKVHGNNISEKIFYSIQKNMRFNQSELIAQHTSTLDKEGVCYGIAMEFARFYKKRKAIMDMLEVEMHSDSEFALRASEDLEKMRSSDIAHEFIQKLLKKLQNPLEAKNFVLRIKGYQEHQNQYRESEAMMISEAKRNYLTPKAQELLNSDGVVGLAYGNNDHSHIINIFKDRDKYIVFDSNKGLLKLCNTPQECNETIRNIMRIDLGSSAKNYMFSVNNLAAQILALELVPSLSDLRLRYIEKKLGKDKGTKYNGKNIVRHIASESSELKNNSDICISKALPMISEDVASIKMIERDDECYKRQSTNLTSQVKEFLNDGASPHLASTNHKSRSHHKLLPSKKN